MKSCGQKGLDHRFMLTGDTAIRRSRDRLAS